MTDHEELREELRWAELALLALDPCSGVGLDLWRWCQRTRRELLVATHKEGK